MIYIGQFTLKRVQGCSQVVRLSINLIRPYSKIPFHIRSHESCEDVKVHFKMLCPEIVHVNTWHHVNTTKKIYIYIYIYI